MPISVLNTYLHKFDSIYYINCQGVANNHTNILTNVQHKIYINGWRMRQTLYFFWIHACIYSFDDRSFSCAQFYFLRIIHVSTDKILLATFKTVWGISIDHVLSFSSLVNRICLTHTFHEFSKFTSIADIHFRNFNEHRKPYILLHLPSNAYSGVS